MSAVVELSTSAAVGGLLGPHPLVDVRIEGIPAAAVFEVDPVEDERRRALGAGAVTSRALLYGLWMLPAGGWVDLAGLPDHKAEQLVAATHVVERLGARLRRTYVPAGQIRAVAFEGASLRRTVHRALKYPPLVRRYAVVDASAIRSAALAEAREWHVGVIAVGRGGAEMVVPAGDPETGLPSVYRWWLAECAFESLLYARAQADSCALALPGPCMPATS